MPLEPSMFSAAHDAFCKYAGVEPVAEDVGTQQAEAPEPKRPPHPVLTAAKRLGGYGLGTGAGMLAGKGMHMGADALHKKYRGGPITTHGLGAAVPLLGGAAALAFQVAQNDTFKTMKSDGEKRRRNGR